MLQYGEVNQCDSTATRFKSQKAGNWARREVGGSMDAVRENVVPVLTNDRGVTCFVFGTAKARLAAILE